MGEYQTADGKTVQFTDGQTIQLVSDLYQYLDTEYRGGDSVDAVRVERILKQLETGSALGSDDWNILNELRGRVGPQFSAWRSKNRDNEGQNAALPTGSGRILEAASIMPQAELAKLREQYATPSTTSKDKALSAAHLLDSVLHDLAHTRQHVARILDADVRKDPQSIAFNAEHALNHAKSGQDHAHKLDKHLAQSASNPGTWKDERALLNQMREAQGLTVRGDQPRADGHHSTICVDFDGVLHQGPHGGPGKVEGTLIKGALQGLKKLAQRYRVVILTARDDLDAVKVWLDEQKLLPYIQEITNIKPPAAAYVDDRGVPFTGWPLAIEAADPSKRLDWQATVNKVPAGTGDV